MNNLIEKKNNNNQTADEDSSELFVDIDEMDEEEIMLNVEWVQALIDLDEEGYGE